MPSVWPSVTRLTRLLHLVQVAGRGAGAGEGEPLVGHGAERRLIEVWPPR